MIHAFTSKLRQRLSLCNEIDRKLLELIWPARVIRRQLLDTHKRLLTPLHALSLGTWVV